MNETSGSQIAAIDSMIADLEAEIVQHREARDKELRPWEEIKVVVRKQRDQIYDRWWDITEPLHVRIGQLRLKRSNLVLKEYNLQIGDKALHLNETAFLGNTWHDVKNDRLMVELNDRHGCLIVSSTIERAIEKRKAYLDKEKQPNA